jgi:hypothetical protein
MNAGIATGLTDAIIVAGQGPALDDLFAALTRPDCRPSGWPT